MILFGPGGLVGRILAIANRIQPMPWEYLPPR